MRSVTYSMGVSLDGYIAVQSRVDISPAAPLWAGCPVPG
jgi:hypothetical protein